MSDHITINAGSPNNPAGRVPNPLVSMQAVNQSNLALSATASASNKQQAPDQPSKEEQNL